MSMEHAASTTEEKGTRKKRMITAAVVVAVILAAVCIFLGLRYFGGSDVKKGYRTCTEISTQVNKIIEPYLNSEQTFDPDEKVLEQAAKDVYAYAQDLKKKGKIKDCAYCEEGYSVSFFQNDGSTTVYMPDIKDAYSGGDDPVGIAEIDMKTWQEDWWGYSSPGKTITKKLSNSALYKFDNKTTVAELENFLQHMDEDDIKALFWSGHGNVYEDNDGSVIFGFCLNEKITEETEKKYAEDRRVEPVKDENGNIIDEGRPGQIATSDSKYAVNMRFFQKYMDQIDGGLFVNGACYGLADNGRMAQAMIDKGFDEYIGATGAVSQPYSNHIVSSIARYLVQCDNGMYMDADTALEKSKKKYSLSLGKLGNDLLNKSTFASYKKQDFRLRYPSIILSMNSARADLDLSKISLQYKKIEKDTKKVCDSGTIKYNDLDNGTYEFEKVDNAYSYEADIYYDKYKIYSMKVNDLSKEKFEGVLLKKNVNLNVCWLDTGVYDDNHALDIGADITVCAQDNTNGIQGENQKPQDYVDENTPQIYRIPVLPGKYKVSVSSSVCGNQTQTVTVDKDMKVSFYPKASLKDYADIVKQYEDQYGQLTFYNYGSNTSAAGISYYSGVFLLKPVDFNNDGTDELVIGYAVVHPAGIDNGTQPAVDVWTLKDRKPVRVCQGIRVDQSDVGKHCGYVEMDGTKYLLSGWSGGTVDLKLLKMENGIFRSGATLKSEENMDGAYVTSVSYFWNGKEISQEKYNEIYNKIYSGAIYKGGIYESGGITKDKLVNDLNETREKMGLGKADVEEKSI